MSTARRIVLTLTAWSLAALGPAAAKVPLKGDPAPDFRLQVFGGGELSLSDLRGKVVLIDFFGYG